MADILFQYIIITVVSSHNHMHSDSLVVANQSTLKARAMQALIQSLVSLADFAVRSGVRVKGYIFLLPTHLV